jgi:cytochrome c oxidase subunit 2
MPNPGKTATFPVFAPHSPYAHSIASLSDGVLWVCLFILLIVIGLVGYSVRRFRERPGAPQPELIYGNWKLEVGYTAAFIVILGTIMYFSIRSMYASDPETIKPDNLSIVAHQWWWEVHYPGTGIVTANEIHIPVDVPQHVALRSADVIHDFWVPELGRKMDIIPGTVNQTWFSADTPGRYYGACAEYCGKEHAWMRIRVIAQTPSDFAQWEEAQRALPGAPSNGIALQGAEYFQELSCASCHTIRGTAARGDIGPDLTHVGSRETLAAGRLQNTPDNLVTWLEEPDLIKPGSRMPNLHLTRDQRDALTAYLEGLQ